MRIPYPQRSSFLEACEEAIHQDKAALLAGSTVSIELSPQGFDGQIRVVIEETNHDSFLADWEQDNPTWFPARIRAAAYALCRQECFGAFEIAHNTGILTIKKVSRSQAR